MDKKFYVTPEMEINELEIEVELLEQSFGGAEFAGEGDEDDF